MKKKKQLCLSCIYAHPCAPYLKNAFQPTKEGDRYKKKKNPSQTIAYEDINFSSSLPPIRRVEMEVTTMAMNCTTKRPILLIKA